MAREIQYMSENDRLWAEWYWKNINELEAFCHTLSIFVYEARNQSAAIRAYENIFHANCNSSSSNVFFNMAYKSIWHELLMELAKLFDPSKEGNNKNCSLLRLKEMCLDKKYASLFPGGENHLFVCAIDIIYEQYASLLIKKSRNKQLSHHDLKQLFEEQPIEISFKNTEELVLKISSLLEIIYSHVAFAEVSFGNYTNLVSQYEYALKQLVVK